jgi:hypothetical protein
VGYSRDASVGYKIRGFLFDAGHFTLIDVPEAGFLEPQAINIWDQIVGVTGIDMSTSLLHGIEQSNRQIFISFSGRRA